MTSEKWMSATPVEVDVFELRRILLEGEPLLLLDCREPDEFALVHLEGAHHIPMNEIPNRIAELGDDPQRHIVVYCHLGGRSLHVVNWLRQQGWERAQSVAGGIDAWSDHIDPSAAKY